MASFQDFRHIQPTLSGHACLSTTITTTTTNTTTSTKSITVTIDSFSPPIAVVREADDNSTSTMSVNVETNGDVTTRNRWSTETMVDGYLTTQGADTDYLTRIRRLGEENLETPAGTIKCIKLIDEGTHGNSSKDYYWVREGIGGRVKSLTSVVSNNSTISMEVVLSSITK